MSDKLPKPPDEDTVPVPEDATPPVEDVVRDTPKEDPDEDDESGMVTGEELRDAVEDIGKRVKTAGFKPFRQMVRLYVNQTLDAVDGLLSALEGNKRKKG